MYSTYYNWKYQVHLSNINFCLDKGDILGQQQEKVEYSAI